MELCKNCGELIGYNGIEYAFTKRKIWRHIIKPFLIIGDFVFSVFNYSVTDKCNKPEPTEKTKEQG